MTMLKRLLTVAAVIGGFTVPGTAQTPYPNQPPQPIYGLPAYGYSETELVASIGQLLGNRFNVTDRTAVQQCASAAMQQAAVQYQPQPSGDAHPYGQGYNTAALMRITAITDVQRRQNGLHVSGLIDGRFGQAPYGHAYGYQNNGYLSAGDLSFRCDIDYRGIVSNLRAHSANAYRG